MEEKEKLKQDLLTQQQIGFARGLFQEEITIHTLLESLAQGVIVVDKSLNILLVNSRAEQMFGYTSIQIIGKPHDILVPERFRGNHKSYMQHYFDEPKIRPLGIGMNLFGLRSDGTEFPVEISLSFVNTQNGLLVMSLISDITIRKNSEEALKNRANELFRTNQELESFSYMVSHDLKTPLNVIIGFSRIIIEEYRNKNDTSLVEDLQKIESSARKMENLIDDILNLSRINRLDMKKQDVDLSQLASSILRELQTAQPDRQVEVMVRETTVGKADKKLINIALSNLLGNAWKFTRKKINAQIEFGNLIKNNQCIYYVKDNGAGFDMTKAESLFVPFKRFHSEKEFTGTGIGLAIVEKVIKRHGGKIWAESELGKGTTFSFTLE